MTVVTMDVSAEPVVMRSKAGASENDRQRAPADQAAPIGDQYRPPVEPLLLVLTECVHASEVVLDAVLGTRVGASAAQLAWDALRASLNGEIEMISLIVAASEGFFVELGAPWCSPGADRA